MKIILSLSLSTRLLIITLIFLGIGVVMIYSSSAIFAERYWQDETKFLRQHCIFLIFSFLCFLFSAFYPYQYYSKLIPYLMVICFILLILVLIPGVGTKVAGARRWIRFFGFGFQPSEILKLTLLIWTSDFLVRKKVHITTFSKGLLPSFIVLGFYLFLLLLEPDFGTAILITFTLLLMTFVAGVKPIHVLGSILGTLVIGFILIITSAYRYRRITAFLDPWADPLDSGYQLINSLIAYGSGGLFGNGLGDSKQKLFFLPQAHTDFIYSVIAEETGFMGILTTMLLFLAFLMTGFSISKAVQNEFGKYLSFGISVVFALQGVIHMSVVTGLMPTKGIGFPFISYGGSSLVVSMLMVGILYNISVSHKKTRKTYSISKINSYS